MAVLKKKTELPRKGETPLSLPFIHKSAANAPVVEKYPISFASLRWHYPNQVRSREYTLLSALFRELPCEASICRRFPLVKPIALKNGLDSPVFRCHNRAKDRGARGLRGSKRFDPFT